MGRCILQYPQILQGAYQVYDVLRKGVGSEFLKGKINVIISKEGELVGVDEYVPIFTVEQVFCRVSRLYSGA